MNQTSETLRAGISLRINGKIRVLILVIVLMALAFVVYKGVLRDLALSVLHREGSSHGVFVPFISGFFLWLEWKKVKSAKLGFAAVPSIILVTAGLLFFFLAKGSAEIAIPALSFLLVAAGLLLGLFGKEVFRQVIFPLLFLVTMIPLPATLYGQIADWMKAISTAGAVGVVKLVGVPIHREVYNICLPDTTLRVSPSCSGIRYLLSFFVFGLAYAFLFKKSIKSRLVIVLATIPISIIGGVLRLSTIFLAAHYISPSMAQHQPHILLSWSVFVIVLFASVGIDRLITKRWTRA